MTVIATIEARMTSSRLPGKMMLPLAGVPVLGVLIERLKRVPELDGIVLATTVNSTDDVLVGVAEAADVHVHRGSEDDVLGRVRGALDATGATICVEITGDCPLTDPTMVSTMLTEFRSTRTSNAYVANTTGPRLGAPHGLDIQVFEADALRSIEREIQDLESREHVSVPFYHESTSARWRPRFVEFMSDEDSHKTWISLDFREDYELIRAVHEELLVLNPAYGMADIVAACAARRAMTRACLALRGW